MNKVIRISILIMPRHAIRNNEFRGLPSLSSPASVFLLRSRVSRETRLCQRPTRLFRAVCAPRTIAIENFSLCSPVRHVQMRKCYSPTEPIVRLSLMTLHAIYFQGS